MDMNEIMIGMLFGCFGMGYLVYGRKQSKGVAFLSGIGLCVMPYFGLPLIGLILLGLVLLILPFYIRY